MCHICTLPFDIGIHLALLLTNRDLLSLSITSTCLHTTFYDNQHLYRTLFRTRWPTLTDSSYFNNCTFIPSTTLHFRHLYFMRQLSEFHWSRSLRQTPLWILERQDAIMVRNAQRSVTYEGKVIDSVELDMDVMVIRGRGSPPYFVDLGYLERGQVSPLPQGVCIKGPEQQIKMEMRYVTKKTFHQITKPTTLSKNMMEGRVTYEYFEPLGLLMRRGCEGSLTPLDNIALYAAVSSKLYTVQNMDDTYVVSKYMATSEPPVAEWTGSFALDFEPHVLHACLDFFVMYETRVDRPTHILLCNERYRHHAVHQFNIKNQQVLACLAVGTRHSLCIVVYAQHDSISWTPHHEIHMAAIRLIKSTTHIVWTRKLPVIVQQLEHLPQLVVASSDVVLCKCGTQLYGVAIENGQLLWTHQVLQNAMMQTDGRRLIVHNAVHVHVYDTCK